tara:strand:+ start:35262 stop:36251 length:990 start_codon:yes stop_codon:yes gene_type:complete
MRKKLFLHIGMNKTGTSSIQDHFRRNRDVFRENGVIYPSLGEGVAAHHALLGWSRSPDQYVAEFAQLIQEARAGERVILSSEALVDLADPTPLKHIFEEFDITVLIYLRDPVRYLLSWWQQDIQMSDQYMDADTYLARKRRSYTELVNTWITVFGRERVMLRVYDRAQLPDGDVVKDFMEITETSNISGTKRIGWDNNPSISGNLLYLKMIYNSLKFPDARSPEMIMALTDLVKLSPEFRKTPSVSPEICEVTRALYESELEELEREFGIQIPISEQVDGIPVPDLSRLNEDFRLIMKTSRTKKYPIVKMGKYVRFPERKQNSSEQKKR